MAQLDPVDLLAQEESQVQQDHQGQEVNLDQQVNQEALAQQDLKEHQEKQDRLVQLVLQDQQDPLDQVEQKERQAQEEKLERGARLDSKGHLELLVLMVNRVISIFNCVWRMTKNLPFEYPSATH